MCTFFLRNTLLLVRAQHYYILCLLFSALFMASHKHHPYTAEETRALLECMFDAEMPTFRFGCFWKPDDKDHATFTSIAAALHAKLPTANGGHPRPVKGLHSYLQKLMKTHKFSADESGFCMAEDKFDVYEHIPNPGLPPKDTKEPINVAAMSHSEQEYLLSQLLHFGGTRILDSLV